MNRHNSGANTNTTQIVADCFILLLAFLVELFLFGANSDLLCERYLLTVVFVFIVVYILANKEARLYNVTLFFYLDRFFYRITKSWLLSTMVTAVMVCVFGFESNMRNLYFIYLGISYLFLCIHMILGRILQNMNQRKLAPRTAFVGSFDQYEKFIYYLNKTSIKLDAIGFILPEKLDAEGLYNVLGCISEIEDIIKSREVDQVYFMLRNNESMENIQSYINICLEMGVTVKVLLDSDITENYNSFVSSVGTYPMITYHTVTLNTYEQIMKRILDVVLGSICFVITLPIMVVTAIAIKADSAGPIIYKQLRVGHNGHNFYIYKFRSMSVDAEERKEELLSQNEMTDGVMFKIKNDPRVTRVGKFIRTTSIDELPQLFNVIGGSMSLVGTRPPTLDEVLNYKRKEWRRISIKPGITGMWQVNGRSNITDFEEVVKLDLQYIDNWSLFLDIKIMLQTIGVLLRRKGAY